MAQVDVQSLQTLVEQGYLTARPHPTADLVIYNYTAKAQFDRYWTPETMMCRGLITTGKGRIVSLPMKKFFNIDELQDLPLEPFTVTGKEDGSLGVSFFVDGKPYLATRGSFTSEQAIKGTEILHQRYLDFPFDENYTYLFEIVFPANRIVVDYGSLEEIILIAVIHTETGQELDIHQQKWPFPTVRSYDGIADLAELKKLEEPNREGFVIRFASGLRTKLKFADYIRLHRLITQVNAKTIWELLRANQPFDEMLDRVPDEYYKWVTSTRDTLLTQFQMIEEGGRQVYEQVKDIPTRKEQAAIVTKTPYAAVVFRMLDGKDYAEIIWKQLRPVAERPFREDIDT